MNILWWIQFSIFGEWSPPVKLKTAENYMCTCVSTWSTHCSSIEYNDVQQACLNFRLHKRIFEEIDTNRECISPIVEGGLCVTIDRTLDI